MFIFYSLSVRKVQKAKGSYRNFPRTFYIQENDVLGVMERKAKFECGKQKMEEEEENDDDEDQKVFTS